MAGRQSGDDKQTDLAVARALFRMDRANPELPGALGDRAWGEVKLDYIKRARKLLKAFDRDGITLLIPEAAFAEGE